MDSTTGSGSSTTNSASTGTGGSASVRACDAADVALIAAHVASFEADVNLCVKDNLGAEPATKTCIEGVKPDGTHEITTACADCYDGDIDCGESKCPSECSIATSKECTTCIATNCTPTFDTCSGL